MGSSPAFRAAFRREPNAATGVSFARYMEVAMYDPEVGYYTAKRRRVGRDKKADFFTSTTFSPVFGELVVAAVTGLLAGKNLADYEFVEMGAEPAGGALKDVPHPFRSYRTISFPQPLDATGQCIVFSNELFDAQPFHRAVWRRGAWRELGVALEGDELKEVELVEPTPELAEAIKHFPREAPEDYHIDAPLRTVPLLERIIRPTWTGLFLAFDYGKSWSSLVRSHPEGTLRTYSHQKMGIEIHDRPGEVDLTGHVCWDWLIDGLQRNGFGEALVESQESFFATRATVKLQTIVEVEANAFSARKQAVMQLLHPGNMGQKFQALHALRE
ncbi:MAG: hypothetical protein C0518_11965 [Opitutus sp.]|nr:hypothetical protein [Opitutus sp.]